MVRVRFAPSPTGYLHVGGARTALLIGFGASLLCGTLGAVVGVASAYFGGRADLLVQRLVDVLLSFPIIIVALAIVSVKFAPKGPRAANSFHWSPIVEVGVLFAGIFATMIPALALLEAKGVRDELLYSEEKKKEEAGGAQRDECVNGLRAPAVHDQRVSRLDQVGGHGLAHEAQADESNGLWHSRSIVRGCSFFSFVCRCVPNW